MSFNFPICMLQTGILSKYRPTSVSFTVTGVGVTHSNDANAYDIVSGYETTTDTTTSASMGCSPTRGTVGDLTAIYTGFSGNYSYTPGQIYNIFLELNAYTETNTSADSSNTAVSYIYIYYSLNGGSTWTLGTSYFGGPGTGLIQTSFSIGSSVTYSQLQIKVVMHGESFYNAPNLSSVATAVTILSLYDVVLY